jgi:hypothetical protein
MAGWERPHLLKERVTVLARHADVGHEHLGALARESVEGLAGRRGCGHPGAVAPQADGHRLAGVILVVHDQDVHVSERGCGLRPLFSSVGRCTRLSQRTVVRGTSVTRQPDDERRAQPVFPVPRRDGPAMQLDQVPHDGQPETQPGVRASARGVGLPETVEDVRHERGIDPGAIVRD